MKKIALALMVTAALAAIAVDRVYDEFVKHWNTFKQFTLAVVEAMPGRTLQFPPGDRGDELRAIDGSHRITCRRR